MGAKRCGRYGYDQTQAPHAPGTIIFRCSVGAGCKSVANDGGDGLRGVDPIRENDAWAVGDASGRTRARQWDGTSWNAVPLPNVVAGEQMAVSAASASDVWAVGHRLTSAGKSRTLIERYTAP